MRTSRSESEMSCGSFMFSWPSSRSFVDQSKYGNYDKAERFSECEIQVCKARFMH